MLKKIKELNEQRKTQKRRKKKYGHVRTKRKQSVYGKRSCLYAAAIAAMFAAVVAISYLCNGQAAVYIGVVGILALILSMFGISAGFNGLRERDRGHTTSRLGIGLNTGFLLLFAVLFLGGLF